MISKIGWPLSFHPTVFFTINGRRRLPDNLAMLIFLATYLSNVAFALYYNIKILLQPFNRDKAINSALKVLAFLIGLSLLCVAITTLPLYANQIGWMIPDEYSDLFADPIILGAVLVVSCKYILEAFTKFRKILEYKEEPEK